MKFFSMMVLITIAFSAQAEESKDALFKDAKDQMIKTIDQRIEHLQKAKGCVSLATQGEQMKACREELKKANASLRNDMKGKREEFKKRRKGMKK